MSTAFATLLRLNQGVFMSSKSAAHTQPRTHSLFSRGTIFFVGLAMIVVYLLTVVVYPLIFNSERNRDSTTIDQPITPPTLPPPIK